MINFTFRDHYTFEDLVSIVDTLRAPGGCPWDREQTHQSLRRALTEESCEVLEAIDLKDNTLLCEELGDVLLQVVFHASLAKDEGAFSMDDVADGICKKMIYRHPHVFGNDRADTSAEVLRNWDAIKRREKGQETYTETLTAVARTLPALWRAEKVQKKAAVAGIDPFADASADHCLEQSAQILRTDPKADAFAAVGEALFAAVAAARTLDIDPEDALNAASDRFVDRFGRAEAAAAKDGTPLNALSPDAISALWEDAKKQQ